MSNNTTENGVCTKIDFMTKLEWGIRFLAQEERREILADYEEHFARGLEEGKSESAICADLGNPAVIAREYLNQANPQKKAQGAGRPVYTAQAAANSSAPEWQKAIIILLLIFVNVCIVAPLWLSLAGVLLGLCAVCIALAVAGIAVLSLTFVQFMCLFAGAMLISLAVLAGIGMFYLIRLFIRATMEYAKINVKLVQEGRI